MVSDVIKLVRNQRCVPRVKEEAALTLTMLLLSDPTSSIVIDMCQGKLKKMKYHNTLINMAVAARVFCLKLYKSPVLMHESHSTPSK